MEFLSRKEVGKAAIDSDEEVCRFCKYFCPIEDVMRGWNDISTYAQGQREEREQDGNGPRCPAGLTSSKQSNLAIPPELLFLCNL